MQGISSFHLFETILYKKTESNLKSIYSPPQFKNDNIN